MSDDNTWAALVPPDAPEPQEGHIMTWGGWTSLSAKGGTDEQRT